MFPLFGVLGGCSPAFVYMFIDALARAGVKHGMRKDQALQIATQSVLGSDAIDWLQRAHPLLGGMTPTQMAATPRGEEKVLALLAAYARGA